MTRRLQFFTQSSKGLAQFHFPPSRAYSPAIKNDKQVVKIIVVQNALTTTSNTQIRVSPLSTRDTMKTDEALIGTVKHLTNRMATRLMSSQNVRGNNLSHGIWFNEMTPVFEEKDEISSLRTVSSRPAFSSQRETRDSINLLSNGEFPPSRWLVVDEFFCPCQRSSPSRRWEKAEPLSIRSSKQISISLSSCCFSVNLVSPTVALRRTHPSTHVDPRQSFICGITITIWKQRRNKLFEQTSGSKDSRRKEQKEWSLISWWTRPFFLSARRKRYHFFFCCPMRHDCKSNGKQVNDWFGYSCVFLNGLENDGDRGERQGKTVIHCTVMMRDKTKFEKNTHTWWTLL